MPNVTLGSDGDDDQYGIEMGCGVMQWVSVEVAR